MIDTSSHERVTLNGACHCGAVKFTVTLTEGFASARRCTCSICRMRGAVAVTSTPEAFRITQGEDHLATYRFNTKTAEHHFCSNCGIYTHHKRRSNPHQLGVNAACLEGISPFDFAEVVVFDGNRHPADNAEHRTYVAGVLRFEPAD
ncbi:MAG: GFA family protein [Bacillota bacterium]